MCLGCVFIYSIERGFILPATVKMVLLFLGGGGRITWLVELPWSGIEPMPPALVVWSLNHWTRLPGKSHFSFNRWVKPIHLLLIWLIYWSQICHIIFCYNTCMYYVIFIVSLYGESLCYYFLNSFGIFQRLKLILAVKCMFIPFTTQSPHFVFLHNHHY